LCSGSRSCPAFLACSARLDPVKQAGAVHPVTAPVPPAVSSATGFGTGGGAGIASQADGAIGDVPCVVGKSPSATGTVVLVFPSTPPTLFWTADGWATLSVGNTGLTYTVTWTRTRTLVPGETVNIHYEWNVAN
jgi:hypothetical protein